MYKMEHNLIAIYPTRSLYHTTLDPQIKHDNQLLYKLDTLQTYLEAASSQPQ